MANITTGSTLYFDTITDATVTGHLFITAIFWTSLLEGTALDIAANDQFMLTEADGSTPIIYKSAAATGDGLAIVLSKPKLVNGIKVRKMMGGVCTIWLQQNYV